MLKVVVQAKEQGSDPGREAGKRANQIPIVGRSQMKVRLQTGAAVR